MYVVEQRKTDLGNWFVGVYVSSNCGEPVGEPIVWDIATIRLDARKLRKRFYKDFNNYVNWRC